jgi:hypothetical protein
MQPSKGLHNQVVKIVVPYNVYSTYFSISDPQFIPNGTVTESLFIN